MPRDLQNKTIAITGASSGIGAATAIACAQAGMNVVLAARRKDRLNEIATRVEALGRRAVVCAGDVRRDDDMEAMVDAAKQQFGQLDVVFANAGYGLFASVMDTTDEQMRDIFETNYFGTLRTIRAAVPVMRETSEQGHILICTSAASEIAIPMYGGYSATKAAQDSIGGALRAELASTNIAVSTVHPIGTRTEFFDVVRGNSVNPGEGLNTPSALMHSSEKVARTVVRCLRKPRTEVWPSVGTRLGVALTTAVPALGAWSIRYIMLRRYKNQLKP